MPTLEALETLVEAIHSGTLEGQPLELRPSAKTAQPTRGIILHLEYQVARKRIRITIGLTASEYGGAKTLEIGFETDHVTDIEQHNLTIRLKIANQITCTIKLPDPYTTAFSA